MDGRQGSRLAPARRNEGQSCCVSKIAQGLNALVDQFQASSGSFTDLTDYVAIGTRAIAALPAFLPLSLRGQ